MHYKELNEYYKGIFGKNFATSTLSKWVKEGRIKAIKQSNGHYDYDFESFKNVIESEQYLKMLKASKTKPQDYIGKIKGELLIKGIVPQEEREDKNFKGTIMYCDCLACGKQNIQVRFSYLSDNGNYHQETCGCLRKEKAFLSSTRKDLTLEKLQPFRKDFEKFLIVHKLLIKNTDRYYTECPLEEYLNAINYFYNDKQFNSIYTFWKNQERMNTYYDWAKPSLDHIKPKSKGGTNKLDNLQILTVFENLCKRDMTQEEWISFKKETNTNSNYFIENIIHKGGKDNE